MTDNDRLLELDGGCVHEWVRESDFATWNPVTDYTRQKWWTCKKCEKPMGGKVTETVDLPAVGDGHEMSLGEMVRLWAKLRPATERHSTPAVRLVADIEGRWYATVAGKHEAIADTPEAALRSAILAAVDGAK